MKVDREPRSSGYRGPASLAVSLSLILGAAVILQRQPSGEVAAPSTPTSEPRANPKSTNEFIIPEPQPFEINPLTDKMRSDFYRVFNFLNEGYHGDVTFNPDYNYFIPGQKRSIAVISIGDKNPQVFDLQNQYSENGQLEETDVYVSMSQPGDTGVVFESLPSQPFKKEEFQPTPENKRTLLEALFKLPNNSVLTDSLWEANYGVTYTTILEGFDEMGRSLKASVNHVDPENYIREMFGYDPTNVFVRLHIAWTPS